MSAFAAAAGLPGLTTASTTQAVCTRPFVMTVASSTHTLNGAKIRAPMVPIGQNILVKIAEVQEETSGGLILSTDAKEKPTHGTAVSVGEGKYLPNGVRAPMNVKEGDTILYGKYGGTDVTYDGDKHCFVTQDDVLCVLEDGHMKVSSVRPVLDRILVKRDAVQEETESGLVLGKSGEKPLSGTVVKIGTGRFMENGETEPILFKENDHIMFGKYAGTDLKFEGEDYLMLRISDVFAKW